MEKITLPDNSYGVFADVDFTYDDWGYLDQRVDQRGITTTYTHDVQGQLRELFYNPGSGVNRRDYFDYDGSGRLVRAYRDPYIERPLEFQRSYDLAGRPTSETLDVDFTDSDLPAYTSNVAYSINTTTHVADWTMTTPAGRQVVHEIDRLGRLISAHDANDSTIGVDWSFDDASRRSAVGYRNSSLLGTTYDYDPNGRTTSIEHVFSLPGLDLLRWGEHYGYDAEGNRTYTERLHTPDRSERYTHDNRNRLVLMLRGTLAADKQSIQSVLLDDRMAGGQQWYDLDRRGNWLSYRENVNGVGTEQLRTVNDVNEYTTFDVDGPTLPKTPRPLYYDWAGNLVSDITAPNWGDTVEPSGQQYVYDGENRLMAVTRTSGTQTQTLIEYEYDALGRRIHTIEHFDTNGVVLTTPRVTRHVYFGMEVIEEYTVDDLYLSNEDDTLAREFIWGDTARFPEPVVMIDYTDAGDAAAGIAEDFHYLHDALGSVVGLINSSHVIVERYTYDPYGKTFIETKASTGLTYTAADTSKYGNPFRWTGQRYDETVNLYSFFFRHYSPRHGRWLQRDPIGYGGGDVNLYGYVLGAPLFFVDPLGLLPDWIEAIYDAGAGVVDVARDVKDGAADAAVCAIQVGADIYNGKTTAREVAEKALDKVKNKVDEVGTRMGETYVRSKEAGDNMAEAIACAGADGVLGGVLGLDENAGVREVTRAAVGVGLAVDGAVGLVRGGGRLAGRGGRSGGKTSGPGTTLADDCPGGGRGGVGGGGAGGAGGPGKCGAGSGSGAGGGGSAAGGCSKGGGGQGGRPSGRVKKMKPDSEATGPHTVWKRDPKTGKITNYETFQPQTNPKNPNPWEKVKRVDTQHANPHTHDGVSTPHVHEGKDIRPARSDELPQ